MDQDIASLLEDIGVPPSVPKWVMPYWDPVHWSGPESPANKPDDGVASPIVPISFEVECEQRYEEDMTKCSMVRAFKMSTQASAICRAAASQRLAECLRGGPSSIRTPFYWG
jgi:hypothetical protein